MNYISGLGNVSTILLTSPLIDGFTCSFNPAGTILSFTGTKPSSYLYGVFGVRALKLNLFLKTRAEYKEFLDFYKSRFGEFKKFWILNWFNEFELTRIIYEESTLAYIRRIGFAERYDGNVRIFMIMNNGDIIVRKVTQSDTISETEESMIFNSAVPYRIYPQNVTMFGRVLLVRFDGNMEAQIQKADGEDLYAKVSVGVIELPHEYSEV